jgi:hypothetical protein
LSQAPFRKFDGLPCFVAGAGDLVEPVVEQVAIGVESHRRRGVTEHLLDHLDVGATGDRETGRGVAELVRVQAEKADRSSGCVEVTASRTPQLRDTDRGRALSGHTALAQAAAQRPPHRQVCRKARANRCLGFVCGC